MKKSILSQHIPQRKRQQKKQRNSPNLILSHPKGIRTPKYPQIQMLRTMTLLKSKRRNSSSSKILQRLSRKQQKTLKLQTRQWVMMIMLMIKPLREIKWPMGNRCRVRGRKPDPRKKAKTRPLPLPKKKMERHRLIRLVRKSIKVRKQKTITLMRLM